MAFPIIIISYAYVHGTFAVLTKVRTNSCIQITTKTELSFLLQSRLIWKFRENSSTIFFE